MSAPIFRRPKTPAPPPKVFHKVPEEVKEQRAAEREEHRTRTPVHKMYSSARPRPR